MKSFKIFNMVAALLITAGLTSCLQAKDKGHAGEFWHTLREGNKDFVDSDHFKKERKKVAKTQNPPCVILGCIDSRVPPEVVFGIEQKLGKAFVCRTAGPVIDDVVVDSLEFTIVHFDTNTLVVLGHSNCGAVIGALDRLKSNGGVPDPVGPGHLHAVLAPIEQAIVAAGVDIYAPDAVEKSVQANVHYVAKQLLANSTRISDAIAGGQIVLIGAEYYLDSGKVKELFRISK